MQQSVLFFLNFYLVLAIIVAEKRLKVFKTSQPFPV